MARRKGKSLRRIKDWNQQYAAGQTEEDPRARRQKLSKRKVKLPPNRQTDEGSQTSLEGLPSAKGVVTGFFPGGVFVRTDEGELLCGIAKTFRSAENSSALAVGDDVTVALTRDDHADASSDDKDRADGMVVSRLGRETLLTRPRPMSAKRRGLYEDDAFEKVIAANMDALLIVAACQDPPLRHGLIDRFLIIAERGELHSVLAINKIDLGHVEESVLDDFRALGVEIHFCSATTGQGIEELAATLTGKRTVLAGASGVGKSTLINAMIPGASAVVGKVRQKDKRGRHTTSASVIYDLPAGGWIIDTPGIRELGMALKPDELPWYFPELEEMAPRCHFNDCTHTHEPNCAVRDAVESGHIPERRYQSYLRLLESLE